MAYTLQLTCPTVNLPESFGSVPVIAIFTVDAFYSDSGITAANADKLSCRDSVTGSWFNTAQSGWKVDGNLSMVDVGLLFSSVLLVFSIAWVFKQVLRQIQNRR